MTRAEARKVLKWQRTRIIKEIREAEFHRQASRLAALSTQVQTLAEADMQVNLVRHPLQPIVLDKWRNALRDLSMKIMAESASLHTFQKELAKLLKKG